MQVKLFLILLLFGNLIFSAIRYDADLLSLNKFVFERKPTHQDYLNNITLLPPYKIIKIQDYINYIYFKIKYMGGPRRKYHIRLFNSITSKLGIKDKMFNDTYDLFPFNMKKNENRGKNAG